MSAIEHILVLADRSTDVQAALRKASVLARHIGARITLHTCDTEHAWAIDRDDREARDTLARCMVDSRRYLDALRSTVAAQDIEINLSATCARSLQDGLTEQVLHHHPDLVIKTLAATGELTQRTPHPLEMQLLKCCAVPLLVTRGRAWRPDVRVAAAIDISGGDLSLADEVVQSAARFVKDLNGQLTVVHAAEDPNFSSSFESLQVLTGSPIAALGDYVSTAQVDVLVIGGPQGSSWQGSEPSLTETLLGAIDCDVLVVPRTRLSRRQAAMDSTLHLA